MFQLTLVTPEKVYYEADVRSLIVPGTEGYLGVLSNHAPLITGLKPGRIEFRDADEKVHLMAVSGGFLEVSGNVATLLADAVEDSDEIDIERAQAAYDRARDRFLATVKGETDFDADEQKAAMERASNRLRVHKETH